MDPQLSEYDDFDEPIDAVIAHFDAGEKLLTASPPEGGGDR